MKELIEKYEEYIEELSKELNELVPIAFVHGWRSKRTEIGIKLRDEIEKLKEKATNDYK